MDSYPLCRPLASGLVLAVCLMAACASPFADPASTKGPSLTVVPGVGRATVTWNPVLGATGYRFEWSTAADFAPAPVVSPAVSPVVIDDLVPGTTYSFRVQAQLKSGPSAWASATLPVLGWAWAPVPETLNSRAFTDTQTLVVAGVSVPVSTTYSVTTVRHEKLKYSSSGLTLSTFLRATTTFDGVPGSKSIDTAPVDVTGSWDSGKLWQSMTLGSTAYAVSNLASDRSSFTLGADPAPWTLTP